jgi:hypothetical protein
LEYAEATLPSGAETAALSKGIIARAARLLIRHGIRSAEEAARDIVALAKGMIDAAGAAGETDQEALVCRVSRATRGYLGD